jgi:hypothetical protein
MCVAAMSLCMIVTRKRVDGRYYFALWQTNNTPNKLLLSESAVSCLLRVRSVSFTSRAKGCITFVPHSCLVSLSHKVGVFLEEAISFKPNSKSCEGCFSRFASFRLDSKVIRFFHMFVVVASLWGGQKCQFHALFNQNDIYFAHTLYKIWTLQQLVNFLFAIKLTSIILQGSIIYKFSQALGYTLWFSLFSLKLNIFPFSASILTFSTQNHLILKYFTNF